MSAGAAAVVAAAGRGERLGEPKAFVELGGIPLLELVVAALDRCPAIAGFVVVAPPGLEDRAEVLAKRSGKLVAVVSGGARRQDSVWVGLAALPEAAEAVVVHDVARPLAEPALFSAVLAALQGADGAVPVVPVADTVKRLEGADVVETVPREGLALVQTPQAFRREALVASHVAAREARFVGTDDATLVERAGYRVVAVPGDRANLKITAPEDLRVAESLLTARRGMRGDRGG